MGNARLDALRAQAESRVATVLDSPPSRLAMRESFYRRFGFPEEPQGFGFGNSEIAFMQWEIVRGVLNPLNAERPGSNWWRKVNQNLIYHAELAFLIATEGLDDRSELHSTTRLWLDYIDHPSPSTWYRAHNGSIVAGYLEHIEEARAESFFEQQFMNEVLIRLLYAQAMVEGAQFAFGKLGELLSNPRLPSVDVITHLSGFYPRNYPLSEEDDDYVMYKAHSFMEKLESFFDRDLIHSHIQSLFKLVAGLINEPRLEGLLKDQNVIYPNVTIPASEARPHQEIKLPKMPKQKIAILGGGISALTAAHELTDYPGWQDRYDITIYTLGWRLGGKMATGRGIHDRIEERGIHIFQGWYDNAFRMIKSAYAEQAARGLAPESPLQTWKDAFIPDYLTLFTEWSPAQGKWLNWPILFPENHLEPGTEERVSVWDIIRKGLGIAMEMVLGTPFQRGQSPVSEWLEHTFFNFDDDTQEHVKIPKVPPVLKVTGIMSKILERAEVLEDKVEDLVKTVGERAGTKITVRFLPDAADLAERIEHWNGQGTHPFETIVDHFSRFMRWMEGGIGHLLAKDDKMRRIMSMLGWMEANMKGMLADLFDRSTGKFNYHLINDYDYRDWLRKHGASEMVLDCAPLRFMYTGSFANLHNGAPGKIAADIGLRMMMLSVSYKGSLVWKLAAGTGDTLIAPMYKVLKARGVKFKFFHKVEEVMYSDTGYIEEVQIGEQVTLKQPGVEYQPMIKVNGMHAWPATPLYDQIDDAQATRLKAEDIDLESAWTPWQTVSSKSLRKGQDFDRVILAIPAAALKDICPNIIARNARWKAMVDNVLMVPTFNVQLWMKPALPEMGMHNRDWGIADNMEPNSVVYANPLYSWTGMSLILPHENFPAGNRPGHLSYFCGTYRVPDAPPYSDHDYPRRELLRLMGITEQWLQDNMGWFLPKATSLEYPQGFDFNLLYDSDESSTQGDTGLRKFYKQFFKLNIDPSNLFALAWPGTDKYRFRADATDFKNLFVCGDWTDIGLNIGHMEAAVIGGLHAAQAIMKQDGVADLKKVIGEAEQFAS